MTSLVHSVFRRLDSKPSCFMTRNEPSMRYTRLRGTPWQKRKGARDCESCPGRARGSDAWTSTRAGITEAPSNRVSDAQVWTRSTEITRAEPCSVEPAQCYAAGSPGFLFERLWEYARSRSCKISKLLKVSKPPKTDWVATFNIRTLNTTVRFVGSETIILLTTW